jgi:hypothetical protein
MMTTNKIGGLYAGRLLIGLANGLFMTFAQLYLQVRLKMQNSERRGYLMLDRNVHPQSIVVLLLEHSKPGLRSVCLEVHLIQPPPAY